MSKKTTKTLVPKLRFPEFRDAGEWEEGKIGDLFNLEEKSEKASEFDSEKIITVKLHANGVVKNERTSTLTGGANYFKRRANEFIFSKIDLLNGAFGLVPDELDGFCSSSDVPAFAFKKNSSPSFFLNWLKANYRKLQVERTGTSSTLKRVAPSQFLDAPIWLPGIAEQQKIADCLSSVDELIAAQAQKVKALKAHKKGLMQQLFPLDGETVPKLRFPEFRDAGEWEEKFIRDLGEITTGSTPSTTKPENYGGERLFVSPADISDQRFIERTKTTLTEFGFSETRPIKAGSILFVCIGSTIGKIAQNLYECATNQQINAVIPSAEYANAFVYYNLEKNAEKISGLAGNHAVPIINKTAFGSIEIRFPRFPEQQKIASCLASIDDLITAQTQKLAALKTHKKGLMQQLFPSIDELRA